MRAAVEGRVWALERRVFQHIMVTSGIERIENQVNFLKSVPLLSSLPGVVLTKLGDVLETEVFTEGEYIVREGTVGDTFYILASGAVRVTQGEAVVRSDTYINRCTVSTVSAITLCCK